MKWPFAFAASLWIAIGLSACLDDGDAVVTRLEIVAPDTAVLQGHTLQLDVRAWDIERRPITASNVVWRTADSMLLTIDPSGLARGTPGRGGGDVIVVASAGPLAADTIVIHVAVHGELKWRLSLGPMPVAGGPALGADGTVFVVTTDDPFSFLGRLHAHTPKGTAPWSVPLSEVRSNSPMVAVDGTALVVGQYVWAIRPDGSVRWSLTTRPVEPSPNTPAFHEGAVGSPGTLFAAMGYDFLALNIQNGDTVWSGPRANDQGWLLPPTVSADGQTVYIKNTGDSLYAFDAATGAVRWAEADPQPGRLAFGVGVAVGNGRIIVPVGERLQELDLQGNEVAVGPSLGLGVSEPAIGGDGTLYVQAPQNFGLYAFSRPDVELWRAPGLRSRWTWYGGPALADSGALYVAAIDGFYAVSVSATGYAVRWRFPVNPADSLVFVGAPLIGADGTVYTFTSCTNGEETLPCSDELFAFWEDKPSAPDSPWPMWRHDARRSGQAHR